MLDSRACILLNAASMMIYFRTVSYRACNIPPRVCRSVPCTKQPMQICMEMQRESEQSPYLKNCVAPQWMWLMRRMLLLLLLSGPFPPAVARSDRRGLVRLRAAQHIHYSQEQEGGCVGRHTVAGLFSSHPHLSWRERRSQRRLLSTRRERRRGGSLLAGLEGRRRRRGEREEKREEEGSVDGQYESLPGSSSCKVIYRGKEGSKTAGLRSSKK